MVVTVTGQLGKQGMREAGLATIPLPSSFAGVVEIYPAA
jgi:hypothetical protein